VEPPLANRAVEREMRELHAILEVMEAMQRSTPDAGDVSDAKSEEAVGENVVGEAAGEDVFEERLLRAVARLGGRSKIEVSMYEGNLDVE
jgi:hypothetical protein